MPAKASDFLGNIYMFFSTDSSVARSIRELLDIKMITRLHFVHLYDHVCMYVWTMMCMDSDSLTQRAKHIHSYTQTLTLPLTEWRAH